MEVEEEAEEEIGDSSSGEVQCNWGSLPFEILHNIFSYLPFGPDWAACKKVNKEWNSSGTLIFDPSVRDNKAIQFAAKNGYCRMMKELLEDPRVDPSAAENFAIRVACQNGHAPIVRALIADKRLDPLLWWDYCIRIAVEQGHWEVVQELLRDKRVNGDLNFLLRMSCSLGNASVVKILLADGRCDPSNFLNLLIPCVKGHWEVVQYLLQDQRVDPSECNNWALRLACEGGHHKVVRLLLKDQRVDASVDQNYALQKTVLRQHWRIVAELLKVKRVNSLAEDSTFMKVVVQLEALQLKLDNMTEFVKGELNRVEKPNEKLERTLQQLKHMENILSAKWSHLSTFLSNSFHDPRNGISPSPSLKMDSSSNTLHTASPSHQALRSSGGGLKFWKN